jgi:curli biogenesis system outer membrane secretion channel CsgG
MASNSPDASASRPQDCFSAQVSAKVRREPGIPGIQEIGSHQSVPSIPRIEKFFDSGPSVAGWSLTSALDLDSLLAPWHSRAKFRTDCEAGLKIREMVAALGLMLATSAMGQGSRPRIAILTFENPASFSQSKIGQDLTGILAVELRNAGKFTILERSQVDELTKGLDLGNADFVKNPSFIEKTTALGVQYVLMGKVTDFNYLEHNEIDQGRNAFLTRRLYVRQADVRMDFSLVRVKTGETIISEHGGGHVADTDEHPEIDAWYRITSLGPNRAEMSSTLIGQATAEAVQDVVDKVDAVVKSEASLRPNKDPVKK